MIPKNEMTEFKKLLKEFGVVQALSLSTEEEFTRLRDQIQFHKYLVNEGIQFEINMSDAVFSWVENVYTPIWDAIESQNIWQEFKHLSRAQLFSNIGSHWYHLKTETNTEVSPVTAALDFCAKFATNSFSRFVYKIKKAVA